jgi:hypothetical protein
MRRAWWKSTRAKVKQALAACQDFDTLVVTYNPRHAGLYLWA